jgi:hypothetical protein
MYGISENWFIGREHSPPGITIHQFRIEAN